MKCKYCAGTGRDPLNYRCKPCDGTGRIGFWAWLKRLFQ